MIIAKVLIYIIACFFIYLGTIIASLKIGLFLYDRGNGSITALLTDLHIDKLIIIVLAGTLMYFMFFY